MEFSEEGEGGGDGHKQGLVWDGSSRGDDGIPTRCEGAKLVLELHSEARQKSVSWSQQMTVLSGRAVRENGSFSWA